MKRFWQAAVLSGTLLAFDGLAHAQMESPVTAQKQPQNPGSALPPIGPDLPASLAEKQARARNEDRQKRLKADTDKLLALATQLHDDVAKTDKNVLSLDVVRRAEEIEKLARAVKERMRG